MNSYFQVFALQGVNKFKCGTVSYENGERVYEITCSLTVADQISIENSIIGHVVLCEVEIYGRSAKGENLNIKSKRHINNRKTLIQTFKVRKNDRISS